MKNVANGASHWTRGWLVDTYYNHQLNSISHVTKSTVKQLT